MPTEIQRPSVFGLDWLMMTLLFVYNLGWNWSANFMLYNGLYLASLALLYLAMREVEVNEEEKSVAEIAGYLRQHYSRKRSNLLFYFDFLFVSNFIMIILYWMPYYFSQIGFGAESIILGLSAPFGSIIASLILVPLCGQCPNFKPKMTVIIIGCSLLTTASILLTEPDKDSFLIYFLQFLAINSLNLVPYTFVMGPEFAEKVETASDRFLMMNFMRLTRELMTAVFMIAIGALMDISKVAFMQIPSITYTSYCSVWGST